MIGKITKGKGFRGLAEYLLRDGRGQIVAGPMAGRTPRELAREFGLLRRLNPKLGKAVAHFSLSPAPGDPPLSDDQWQAIADGFMSKMGFADAPWCAVIHRDTDHEHLHLMACRIDKNGKTVSDANDFRRTETMIRGIESDFGLVAVVSPPKKKRRAALTQSNQITRGDSVVTDPTELLPNPFPPSDPQHATWPEPFEPGRDLAELAIIESTPTIIVPSAYKPDAISKNQQRELRRTIIEDIYSQQVLTIFSEDLTRIYKHAGGATLYFRGAGRIADQGHKLTALGGMPDELAAIRIVKMALNPPKCWKQISFTGSEHFIELAMREARKHRLSVLAVGKNQQAILAKLIAEDQGGMGAAAMPGAGGAAEADPTFAPLSELDDLPLKSSPVIAPSKETATQSLAPTDSPTQPPKEPVSGVLPVFLNLRERIRDRRQNPPPEKPAPSKPTAPRNPGLR